MKNILVAIVLAASVASAGEIRPSGQTVNVNEYREVGRKARVLDGQDLHIVVSYHNGKDVIYHDIGNDGIHDSEKCRFI
jgi:hypothetical protein